MFGPGTFSIWHWLIVLAVVVLLFGGGGKISRIMGDFGSGLKAFKKSVKDEEKGEGENARAELEANRTESAEKSTVKG